MNDNIKKQNKDCNKNVKEQDEVEMEDIFYKRNCPGKWNKKSLRNKNSL